MPLHAERLSVAKRTRKTLVRAARTTTTVDSLVDEELAREQVVVERVAVGRVVDAVPPVRQEGDVTIMPVVEEELVVVRRLVLKEEVHLRRVRTTARTSETVTLREQNVASPARARRLTPAAQAVPDTPTLEGHAMTDETIVAVYDTAAHAEAAVAGLKRPACRQTPSACMPARQHVDQATTTGAPVREQGFWASLFGGEPDHDTAVYDRSLAGGSTVVSVKAPEAHIAKVMEILESHHPIDIDERATSYGLTQTTTTRQPLAAPMPCRYAGAARRQLAPAMRTLQLSEESLAVGKRVVNRGGTRIRRFVVETPVEESVTLHSEKVVLERHPVTDGRPCSDSFSEKTIEMTESAEEAVVSKTARVYEEVGLRKEATDRVETVRDTVRKEEVEVEQVPGTATTTTDDKRHDRTRARRRSERLGPGAHAPGLLLENTMSRPLYNEPPRARPGDRDHDHDDAGGSHVHRRISWGAIFGGVILVVAVQLLLSLLGAGIGLDTVNTNAGTTPDASSLGIGAGAWWIISSIIALAFGGYAAAWLAGIELRWDGVLHGLITWGIASLLTVYLLSSAIGGIIGGSASALGGIASAAGSGIKDAAQPVAQAAGVTPDMLQQQAQAYLKPANPDPATMSPQDAQKEVVTNLATYAKGGPDARRPRRASSRSWRRSSISRPTRRPSSSTMPRPSCSRPRHKRCRPPRTRPTPPRRPRPTRRSPPSRTC